MGLDGRKTALAAGGTALLLAAAGCSTATPNATGSSSTPQATVSPAASSSAPIGGVQTTIHDNDVVFKPNQGISQLRFTWDGDYNITAGQPWQGMNKVSQSQGGDMTVTVKAGRSSSAGPARWFGDRVTEAIPTYTSSRPAKPTDLNFAFTGTISINFDSYPVTIGQGHLTNVNNWWIGGKDWRGTDAGSERYKIATPDGKYRLTNDGNSSNSWFIFVN